MSFQLSGNVRGLAPSQIRQVERLFRRRLLSEELISVDLGREVFNTAAELGRRVGLLVSREGYVEEVCVGSKEILYLPDLGRYRLGKGRLRRLRLIFSDLSRASEAHIPADIYTDLEKLRLDAVVGVKALGNRIMAAYAHIVPQAETGVLARRTEKIADVGRLDFNFIEFIRSLEEELARLDTAQTVVGKDAALLVGVYAKGDRQAESSMAELKDLVRTAGVHVRGEIMQRREPDPRTLLGKGKIEEVVLCSIRVGAQMMIFDIELRPSQWRAITNATDLKVLDRSMLILDIFAQRAKSSEGRLQVELAQLKYNLPRLVEKDAGLSRLTGGIGGRGPGETKLEIGRRRIRDRISDLEKRIDRLTRERSFRTRRRTENQVPLVSVLGYTNVGKSTLFNALTGSQVLVEDKLFATLDPAQRRLSLPPWPADWASGSLSCDTRGRPADAAHTAFRTVILSDTVGFIRNLPEELKNAFRATLEDLRGASLLVHVLDASDPEIRQRKDAVEKILGEMELDRIPQIAVINKVDLVETSAAELLEREFTALGVSAVTREGLDGLKREIARKLFPV